MLHSYDSENYLLTWTFYIRCSLLPIGTLLVYIFAATRKVHNRNILSMFASYIASLATKAVAKALLSLGATMKNLNFLVEGFAKMAFLQALSSMNGTKKWERRKKPCKVHLMPPFSIERGQDTKFEILLVSPARNVPVAFCTWCQAPNAATGFDAPRAAIEFLWSTFRRVKVCIWISWNREAKRKKNSAIFQFLLLPILAAVFLLHSSMPYLTFSCLRKVI